jgi:hypothetical protein
MGDSPMEMALLLAARQILAGIGGLSGRGHGSQKSPGYGLHIGSALMATESVFNN